MSEPSHEHAPNPKLAPGPEGGAAVSDDGFSAPLPEVVPRPTWWPASVALGVMLMGWGAITSLTIFLIGAALLASSVVGWIGEIRHERNEA